MADLFKFRCYQCEKLLGAPRSKLGKVIHCPKCGAELIVPAPEDDAPPLDEPGEDAVRLEDLGLRLEPEPEPEPPAAPPGPDPIAFLVNEAAREPVPGEPDDILEPEPPPIEGLPEVPDPHTQRLAPGSRRRARSELVEPAARRRDVILPRTAAVAWSLSALAAQAFAFAAGMLIGHYLWK